MKKNRILLLMLLMLSPSIYAQTIFGKWKTIDDRSGKAKSIVEIYKKDGKVYGAIRKILEKGKEDAVCIKCEGDLKNKPIIGMKAIRGMKKDGDVYKGGKLFDPENNREFKGKIWLNPDNSDELMVRGYLAFFYRTQTWHRVR
ncbi:DUF2147 domain-containing protein [Allomuricauda sp. d1]|uniref:DUF2147 domain-containing protein n=1 Tax=Allomuricauda sp. d1 TaxID=3136725 RepID=UPI0031DD260B